MDRHGRVRVRCGAASAVGALRCRRVVWNVLVLRHDTWCCTAGRTAATVELLSSVRGQRAEEVRSRMRYSRRYSAFVCDVCCTLSPM
jgi:hypothetical protein